MQSAVGSVSDRLGAENDVLVGFQVCRSLIDLEVVKIVGTVMRGLLESGVRLRFGCIITE